MKVLITSDSGYMSESEDTPEVGRSYFLEDATDGTLAQNRLFHALLTEYHISAAHPVHGGDDWITLRSWVKKHLGAGFESFVYVAMSEEGIPVIEDAKKYNDIPEEIRNLPWKKKVIRGRLVSWADYTLKQRKQTIDKLIRDMLANGVASKKFDEILREIKYEL